MEFCCVCVLSVSIEKNHDRAQLVRLQNLPNFYLKHRAIKIDIMFERIAIWSLKRDNLMHLPVVFAE